MKDKVIQNRKPKTNLPILDSIKNRFSPRVFAKSDISTQDIEIIMEAARLTPSGRNHQPWNYIVIKRNTPAYERLMQCIPERNLWCSGAPIYILSSYDPTEPNDGINKWCKYDLGAANISLILQAQELGYYSRQIGSFDTEKAKEIFDIQDPYVPFVLIAMGAIGDDVDYENSSDDINKKELMTWERKENIYKIIYL